MTGHRRRANRAGGGRARRRPAAVIGPNRFCCRAMSTPTCMSTSQAERYWEGFASATEAAARGGITTIVDMPLNSIPATIDSASLDAKRASAAHQAHVDVGFLGGAVPQNLGRLEALWDEGVFTFKRFLVDSGVPEFAPLDRSEFGVAMAEVARFGGRDRDAEDPDVIAGVACMVVAQLSRVGGVPARGGRDQRHRNGCRAPDTARVPTSCTCRALARSTSSPPPGPRVCR